MDEGLKLLGSGESGGSKYAAVMDVTIRFMKIVMFTAG